MLKILYLKCALQFKKNFPSPAIYVLMFKKIFGNLPFGRQSLTMIRLAPDNFKAAVELFQQDNSCQAMGKSQCGEGEAKGGALF